MARLTRLTVARQMHFVVQRGHGLAPVFVDDTDRHTYLDALQQAAHTHQVAIHAFVLLDDQVQWLATPQEATGLSRVVQAIGQRFVGAFNRRHGLRGTRWEGRFRSAVVDAASLGVSLGVLMEQEAPATGLAFDAADWPWSTARHHLGLERLAWIVDSTLLWGLGNTPYEREAAYAKALSQPLNDNLKRAITNAAARGWALGDDAFVQRLQLGSDRPIRPKQRGRPIKY